MHIFGRNESLKSLTVKLFCLLLLIQLSHSKHLTTSNYPNNDTDNDDSNYNNTDSGVTKSNTKLDPTGYLAKYGYLPMTEEGTEALISEEPFNSALRAFQKFANIPITGKLDSKTEAMMALSRCGVPDFPVGKFGVGSDRNMSSNKPPSPQLSAPKKSGVQDFPGGKFGVGSILNLSSNKPPSPHLSAPRSKWNKKVVTYRLVNFTPDLDKQVVYDVIRRSFQLWATTIDLKFEEKFNETADIEILFAKWDHGCVDPFDGPGGHVAHSFYPNDGVGGDIHFDDDEYWTEGTHQGTNLFATALHEIGHTLGLDHLEMNFSIMFPWKKHFPPPYRLSYEDVLLIQAIYGPKSQVKSTQDHPSAGDCGSKVDAVSLIKSEYYFFHGKKFYRFSKMSNLTTKPEELRTFREDMPESLERIDAVFVTMNHVYFFSGKLYWKYSGKKLAGFPREGRPITDFNLPASLEKIDAAFKWSTNKRVYLISGDKFWRLNNAYNRVDKVDPKNMSSWKDVKLPVDAAFTDKGITYFFNGPNFWAFNNKRRRVQNKKPKEITNHWFKCPIQAYSSAPKQLKEQSISDASATSAHQLPFVISSLAVFVTVWMSAFAL